MQALAVVADAAETAAGPRLVRRRRRKKFQLAAAFNTKNGWRSGIETAPARTGRRKQQQRRCQGKLNGPSDGGQNHLSCPLRIFLATLLRPSTSRSASARVMSGVNDNTPPAMRWEMKGAASQRPSARRFTPLAEDDKMFSGVGGGVLFEDERADSVKLNFDGKAAARVNDPGRDDAGFRQDRLPGDGE